MLGTPAEMFVFGTQYWMIGLAYPMVLAATAHIYLPVFFKLGPRYHRGVCPKEKARQVRGAFSFYYDLRKLFHRYLDIEVFEWFPAFNISSSSYVSFLIWPHHVTIDNFHS